MQPSKLEPEQRLIAALLREDAEHAAKIILELSQRQDCLDNFSPDNIAGLIYERICQLGLLVPMGTLSLSSGIPLLERLRQDVIMQAFAYRKLNGHFLELLDILGDLGECMVWLKGTSLSRTLYHDSKQRFSVDFDITVRRKIAEDLVERLRGHKFSKVWHDPGYCHQFGVGPLDTIEDLFIVPHPDCEGCHNLTLKRSGFPEIELKFSPLETGLIMKDLDRFFADAHSVRWQDSTFLAPHPIDHLMIELVHFHKHRFGGWAWLYDIHLLAKQLSDHLHDWDQFVMRCHNEGVTGSAWKGLSLARNLLDTPVPVQVLESLCLPHTKICDRQCVWLISSEFIWNCNSLPVLFLNAIFTGGWERKLRLLGGSFLPSDLFLSRYYAHGARVDWFNRWLFLLLHWLVLVLPGGAIRRTIGKVIWLRGSDSLHSAASLVHSLTAE